MRDGNKIGVILPYVAVCALPAFFLLPLFHRGYYQSHDGFTHILHLIEINYCLGHGILYPRWLPDIYWGYGGPVFTFYPPLLYYCVLPFYWLTKSYFLGFKIAIGAGVTASGLLMYHFSRIHWGKPAALLTAAAYVYAPYHVIDIYVRGAYLESLNYILLPAILILAHRMVTVPGRRTFGLLALLLGVSFVSHLLCFLYPLLILLYAFSVAGGRQFKRLALLAPLFVLALCLSAFFLIPLALQRPLTHATEVARTQFDFHGNFASLARVLSPAWPWGSTVPGPHRMSLQIGLVHIAIFILSIIALPRLPACQRRIALCFQVLTILCVFMMLPCSTILWEKIPLIFLVQFPWRLLLFVNFFTSFLAGAALRALCGEKSRLRLWIAAGGVVAILILYGPCCRTIYPDLIFPTEAACNRATIYTKALGWHEPQYVPRWVERNPAGPPRRKVILEGPGRVEEVRLLPHLISFRTSSPMAARCTVNIFYYPCWKLYLDGLPGALSPRVPTGEILLELPPGNHRAEIRFTAPPSVIAACMVSLVSLLVIAGLLAPHRAKSDGRDGAP